ncbi:MAG: sensor histidine kinase [Clostridia bacterium]|nr:sensor histidine kinase [Clostridia bacterium]MBQ7913708.1 sensor histidine kinase [Clostridia bacterium]
MAKNKQEPTKTDDATSKRVERREENPIRNYFVRLFGKINFKNEAQFLYFGKWLVFLALLAVEILMILQHVGDFKGEKGWINAVVLISLVVILAASEAIQLFAVRGKAKFVFYAIDTVAACGCLFFAYGVYPLVLYILVLTQFYIGAEKFRFSGIVFGVSMPLYAVIYGMRGDFTKIGNGFLEVLWYGLGSVIAITFHFLAVQIALAFYRQYLKLDKAVRDLNESQQKLQKAYEAVAEVTALEERQRIAKEIHDTAGHSITTVIMQTEAAKRIVDSNPDEAKNKLVAANLQAKHALEELRDSVHLLSGRTENQTLRSALQNIVNESTDGTGIVIRSSIQDVCVSAAKFRFLCNSLKEGISNGLRHGGATAFWFELSVGEEISFLLSDNGRGMYEVNLKKGFGLTTMQDRAKALGGGVEFKTEEGEGFEIRLTLPLDKEED